MSYLQPFKIQLDEPRQRWTAGDRISGSVVLNSRQDESVGTVTIALFARAKVKMHVKSGNNRKVIRSRAPLIELAEKLYSSHFTLRPDNYKWDFAFTIPEQPMRHTATNWSAEDGFLGSAEHPLPPTMSCHGTRLLGGTSFDCFTEYILKAKLTRPAQDQSIFSFNNDLESEMPLFFEMRSPSSAPRAPAISHRANFNIRSLLLDPSHSGTLSFKEKMRSTFKSSTLPVASFEVVFAYPTAINLGECVCIKAQLTHNAEHTTAPALPEVTLQSLRVKVTRTVSVRSESRIFSDYTRSSDETVFAESFQPRLFKEDSGYVLDIITGKLEARNCQPSFVTYNIRQQYNLEVSYMICCADQTETRERSLPFIIYPRSSSPVVEGSVAVEKAAEANEALPLYTPADRPAYIPEDEPMDGPAYATTTGTEFVPALNRLKA